MPRSENLGAAPLGVKLFKKTTKTVCSYVGLNMKFSD